MSMLKRDWWFVARTLPLGFVWAGGAVFCGFQSAQHWCADPLRAVCALFATAILALLASIAIGASIAEAFSRVSDDHTEG